LWGCNLKKVLTLVLTVAMLLSVMVVGTGAAFSDQDSIKNKEAVDVCTTLNIIAGMEDGSYRPANNVTRAQMCKMICVALNGGKEPTLGTNATPTFSDVRTDPSSSWAESFIESCNSQGIVSGVGGGRFSPSGSVTGTQAARMLLVALGYRADQEGFTGDAWAINVNTRASAKGLYKGIESIDANAALSRDNAAQMIWNALNAYEVEYVSQLTTVNGQLSSELVAQDKVVGSNRDKITMLEDKYEADTAVGVFAGDSNVINTLDKGNIQIDKAKINGEAIKDDSDFVFKYDLDLKYLGEEVKVLYRDNSDGVNGILDPKDTIYGVYVTGATTVYNITKNDLQNAKGDTDIIRFGDKDYKVAAAEAGYTYIDKNYGGDSSTKGSATADQVAAALNTLKETSADTIKLVCDNGGKIAKAYVVEYKLARVTAVNNENVSLNNGIGTIKIADNDVYSGIAKDDIVVATTWYASIATSSSAFTTVTKADVVEGKLTAYNGVKSVSVEGSAYDIHKDDISTNKSLDSANFVDTFANQIGETIRVYLIDGIVYAAEMVTEASQYAVVEAATGAIGSTFDPLKAKIMKADGTEVTVEIHKDSTDDAKATNKSLKEGAVIKYSEVSDGKIKVSEIVAPTAASGNMEKIYNKDTKQFAGTVAASDGVLFVNKGGDFYVYTIRNLNNITLNSGDDYAKMLSDGKVVAGYLELDSKPSGASSETVYGIVANANGTVKEGDTTYTSWTVQVDDNRDNDKTVLIEGTSSYLDEGYLVGFDVSSDNVYSDSDVTIYLKNDGTDINVAKAKNVGVSEYDESGKIITYWTTNSEIGDSTKEKTVKAVDNDVEIIFVDSEDDTASAATGAYEYDGVKNKANAVVVFENNNTEKVVAIFFDIDGDITQ